MEVVCEIGCRDMACHVHRANYQGLPFDFGALCIAADMASDAPTIAPRTDEPEDRKPNAGLPDFGAGFVFSRSAPLKSLSS